MIGVTKAYDDELGGDNDPRARKKAIELLRILDIDVEESKNKYGIDLVTTDKNKNGRKTHFEVSVRGSAVWPTKGRLKYSTLHVECRKQKYLKEDDFILLMFSNDLSEVAWLTAEKVRKYLQPEYAKEVPNRLVTEGEYFFDIPVEEWTFLDVKAILKGWGPLSQNLRKSEEC